MNLDFHIRGQRRFRHKNHVLQSLWDEEKDFEYINISGQDFRDVDFSGCNFEDSLLQDCDFTGCNFTDCNLEGTNFKNSDLKDCIFENAILNEKTIISSEYKKQYFEKYSGILSRTHVEDPLIIHEWRGSLIPSFELEGYSLYSIKNFYEKFISIPWNYDFYENKFIENIIFENTIWI